MSSTTLASRKTGEPSPRAMTKSSMQLVLEGRLAADQVDDHGRRPRRACGSAAPGPRPGRGRGRGRSRRSRCTALPVRACDVLAGAVAVVGAARRRSSVLRRPRVLVGVRRLEVAGPRRCPARCRSSRSAREDALGPLGPVARGVGVLDAQHEHAAVLLGVDPVLQRRAGAADVEHTGRGGGEAHAYRHVPQPTAVRDCFPPPPPGSRHRADLHDQGAAEQGDHGGDRVQRG